MSEKDNITILIAEDHQQILELIERTVKTAGYKSLSAKDGREALMKFQENQELIDLVISDIKMPNMDGQEFYEKAKRIKPNIKFLFISSLDKDMLRIDFSGNENLDFLQKPFRIKELLDKISNIPF